MEGIEGGTPMKSVKQLLHSNPSRLLVSVTPDATVIQALNTMNDHNIGSVVVMDDDKLIGIFTERDYIRNVVLKGLDPINSRIGDLPMGKVCYVTPEYTLDEVMALMTEKRIRHVPVLDHEQKVIAIVSIGDLVKSIIDEQTFEIEQLVRYITG
jgi:CBS domain-containing protein